MNSPLSKVQENTASAVISYLSYGYDNFYSAEIHNTTATLFTTMGNAIDIPLSSLSSLEAAEDYLFKAS